MKKVQDVEAVVLEEREENPLFIAYTEKFEQLSEMLRAGFQAEGLTKEATYLTSLVISEVESFILRSGLIESVEKLVRIIDDLAAVKPANIKDNALNRTIKGIAKSHGTKVSTIRDFASQLNSANVEIKVESLYKELKALEADHKTAVRISHQYDSMEVPAMMTDRLHELRAQFKNKLEQYPHLKDTYPC